MNSPEIGDVITQYSYLGIFLWFIFFDQLTVIPEEISLITIGYISTYTSLNLFLCGIVSLLGLLAIDNIYYFLTYKGSNYTKRIFNKLNNNYFKKLKQKVMDNSWTYLFIIELIPRLRILSPIISASSKIGFRKFTLINTTATSVVVFFYLFVGVFFENSLDYFLKGFKALHHFIFAFILITILFIIYRFLKNGYSDK